MIVSKYGVDLVRLTIKDIELVRKKRNEKEIASKMVYQEYITEEEQLKWFAQIDNDQNFYFIIRVKGVKVGLINAKDIDWQDKTTEAGIFIWDQNYRETHIPALASFIIMELGFDFLGWEKVSIRILNSNRAAIDYNRRLGYELVNRNEDVSFYEFNYKNGYSHLRTALKKMEKVYQREDKLKVVFHSDESEMLSRLICLLDESPKVYRSDRKDLIEFQVKSD